MRFFFQSNWWCHFTGINNIYYYNVTNAYKYSVLMFYELHVYKKDKFQFNLKSQTIKIPTYVWNRHSSNIFCYFYFQITGTWYVIEILQHKTDEKLYRKETFDVSTCPSIFLMLAASSDTDLKLYWNEDSGDVEYLFRIRDKSSPGFWQSIGPQNGKI